MTAIKRLFDIAILAVLIGMLMITLGGKSFDKVVLTQHWSNDHAECIDLKNEAIQDGAQWQWWNTPRGMCAIYKSAQTGAELVIVLVIVKKVITLITGYNPNPNAASWKQRPGNHF